MEAALNRKWFLERDVSKFSPDFRWAPDRETRVLLDGEDGLMWYIAGESHGEKYAWRYSVQRPDVRLAVFDCLGIDEIMTHHINENTDIGTYYLDDQLVGGFYYEMKVDDSGLEFLQVIDTGLARSGKPLYKIMQYRAGKL
jgi:hypothetical protein